MTWTDITTIEQINTIAKMSSTTPCVIYKHSTKCYQSEMIKYILESEWPFESEALQPYCLDILQHREIAVKIAEVFEVYHQSPQLLLIQDGECTFDVDHLDISVEELKEALEDDFWSS